MEQASLVFVWSEHRNLKIGAPRSLTSRSQRTHMGARRVESRSCQAQGREVRTHLPRFTSEEATLEGGRGP